MTDARDARVAVLGAGAAGLAAAWHLARAGLRVTVFEKAPVVGGMAAAFDLDGLPIDRYYHYFNGADHEVARVIAEVLPGEAIRWRSGSIGIRYGGSTHAFSTPLDLLTFPPLTPVDRARMVAHLARYAAAHETASLRDQTATAWLRRWLGERGYQALWAPLLRQKFGRHAEHVSAAWLQARIRRMATNPGGPAWRREYGYLPGGAHRLMDALARACLRAGVEVRAGQAVGRLDADARRVTAVHADGRADACDGVVSTLPLPVLEGCLGPSACAAGGWRNTVDYVPVTVLVLVLDRPLVPYFWLNTNDPEFCFPGVVQYTNLDPYLAPRGLHVAHLPFYGDPDQDVHALAADDLLARVLPELRLIDPGFDPRRVVACRVFRDRYGQSVCVAGEARLPVPGITPWANLFLTDSSLLHPEDRTIAGALTQGRRAASQLIRALGAGTR